MVPTLTCGLSLLKVSFDILCVFSCGYYLFKFLFLFSPFLFLFEPLVRIELTTSSLPRKCSTTELQRRSAQQLIQLKNQSGRPGSNRPPIAWKAIALPNELLPLDRRSFSISYH